MVRSGRLDFQFLWRSVSFFDLVAIFGCAGVSLYFGAERIRALLRVYQIEIPTSAAVRFTLIGVFFNYVLPGGLGGDVVKALYIYRYNPQARERGPLAVVVDRAMGLFTLLLIFSFFAAFNIETVRSGAVLYKITMTVMSVTAVFCVIVATMLMVNTEALANAIQKRLPLKKIRLLQALPMLAHTFFSSPRLLLRSFSFSFVAQLVGLYAVVLAGRALGFTDISLADYLYVISLSQLISAVPLTPAGIGVGQAVFLFVTNTYLGQSSNLGPSMVTIFQIVNLLWGIVGAWYYVQTKKVAPLKA